MPMRRAKGGGKVRDDRKIETKEREREKQKLQI